MLQGPSCLVLNLERGKVSDMHLLHDHGESSNPDNMSGQWEDLLAFPQTRSHDPEPVMSPTAPFNHEPDSHIHAPTVEDASISRA